MPRLSLDAELDRLLAESQDSSRYTDLSIVLRRLTTTQHVPAGSRLVDPSGNTWVAGELRDGVQPVASSIPGVSRAAAAGLPLAAESCSTTLHVEEVLRAGGVWDNVRRDWRRDDQSQRIPSPRPVIVDLQESQIDAARWFAERLAAFRERRKHDHCVGLLLDDRRGGKSFVCTLFILCAAVDCPTVNGSPLEAWIVCQSHPARDEIDEIIKALLPPSWAKYRELPKRMWSFMSGAKLHMKTTDDPESLRVGRVDFCFFNEMALLSESAFEIALRACQDRAGCLIAASNRPRRSRGRFVIRLWEGAERDVREGKIPAVKTLRVPPALNTAIDHEAKAGIARAILYAKDVDDESQLDEGLILEAGQKLLAPPWDDNLHIRRLPQVGLVDVTAQITQQHFGKPFEFFAGADFQSQCAAAVFRLLAPGGRLDEVQMWCVCAIFLTDKDNGDEDDLCDALTAHGFPPDRVLVCADSSGKWQDGKHTLGPASHVRMKRRGFEVIGPTRKKTASAQYAKNPDVEASVMRLRKWIAAGRFFVADNTEAQKMAVAAKRCDAYLDRYNNLKGRGRWNHLVDSARYPQWWLTEKLAATTATSNQLPAYYNARR